MTKPQWRKWQPIDLINLYCISNSDNWNNQMSICVRNKDVLRLQKMLYGVQAGMADLVKNKIDTEKMHVFFIRLQRSLENTAKIVFRKLYPSPLDEPTAAALIKAKDPVEFRKWLTVKRKRDEEFEKWRKGASF